MCVRGGIHACLSVCILHLAHDWSGIHLEGREVLSLTDNSFHIVKNHKQTVRVGNCSDDSASTNQSSHTDATLYAKVQLTCSHRGMSSGHSPPWVHFFFFFSYWPWGENKFHFFSPLKRRRFITFTGSLPTQCTSHKANVPVFMHPFHTQWNFALGKQTWLLRRDERVKGQMEYFRINNIPVKTKMQSNFRSVG